MGVCAEPILIPLQSVDSNKRFPLDESSLEGNVVLMNESGNEIATQISSDGSNVIIQCESGLKENTEYFIVVTDRVKTEFGESLKADSSFTDLVNMEFQNKDEIYIELEGQVQRAISLFKGDGNPVYAAQFKTQSSYASLDAMRANHEDQVTAFIGSPTKVKDSKRKFDVYEQKITLPFYLPFTEDRESECIVDRFEPKESCPPLYEWMTTEQGGFPTKDNPLPKVVEFQHVLASIYTPYDWNETAPLTLTPLKTVLFIHGIGADKSAAELMAQDYTDKGYAVVAIDMPYHGLRVRHDANGEEISASANKANFINVDSPLALRSNLQQTVSDFLGVRYALGNQPWVDANNIHLVGHSLGGIMSVMVTEFSQSNPDFEFKTANFVVPGQGLTNLTLTSKILGPEMSDGVKKSPDVQRAIAETVIPDICTTDTTNEECMLALEAFVEESSENKGLVQNLEDDIFDLLITGFKQGVQMSIDSADPASFTTRQKQNQQPTLLMAAVGDCGETCEVGVEYAPDTVVPNSAPDNIRTGTNPLIEALGLEQITGSTGTVQSGFSGRGFIGATTGGHGTYLFPYEGPVDENGLPSFPETQDEDGDGVSEMDDVRGAMETQQVAVASMVLTQGSAVVINNKDHIETEVPENEE